MQKFAAVSLFALPLLLSNTTADLPRVDRMIQNITSHNYRGLDYIMFSNSHSYGKNSSKVIHGGYSSKTKFDRVELINHYRQYSKLIYSIDYSTPTDVWTTESIIEFDPQVLFPGHSLEVRVYKVNQSEPDIELIDTSHISGLFSVNMVEASSLEPVTNYKSKEHGNLYCGNDNTWYELWDYIALNEELVEAKPIQLDYLNRIDLSEFVVHFDRNYWHLPQLDTAKASIALYPYVGNMEQTKYTNIFGSNFFTIIENLEVYRINEYELGIRPKTCFYVNSVTKEMSLVEKEGYVETQYIYLPNCTAEPEVRFFAMIEMYDLGFSNSAIRFRRNYIPNYKAYFTSCYEGEYCVTSESANPDFNIGSPLNA